MPATDELDSYIKYIYKIHQELHGKKKVYFSSVCIEVRLKYPETADSDIFEVLKELL